MSRRLGVGFRQSAFLGRLAQTFEVCDLRFDLLIRRADLNGKVCTCRPQTAGLRSNLLATVILGIREHKG